MPPHRIRRTIVVLTALFCGCIANAQPMGQEKPPELREYHDRLRRMAADPPGGEYVAVTVDGSFVFRRLNTWIKASPAASGAGGLSRRFTVFLDDSVGNRLRTLPDQIEVSVAPPARLKSEAVLSLRKGEASGEVLYAPGQLTARLTIVLLPRGAGMGAIVDLPAANSRRPQLLGHPSTGEPGSRTPPSAALARANARRTLQDARAFARSGRRFPAQSLAFTRAQILLEAGLVEDALEAFRLGATEFASALCAWGEVQLLRALGRYQEAERGAEALVLKSPDGVPTAFAQERAGELWFVPMGALFGEIREARPR